MATVDVSSINGFTWSLTTQGRKPIRYSKEGIKYFFTDAATSTLRIEFPKYINDVSITVLLTDLRVAGAGSAPVSEAAALTALDSVFLKAGSAASTTDVDAGTSTTRYLTPSLWTYIKTLALSFSNYISARGFKVTGTAGAGFVEAVAQSSNPAAPASGFRLFANSLGKFSWLGSNGFLRVFDGISNTADRTYTLTDHDGKIPVNLSASISGSDVPTTSATLSDITGLSVTPLANTVYDFEAELMVGTNNTGGVNFAIDGPVGSTMVIRFDGITNSNTAIRIHTVSALASAVGTFITIAIATQVVINVKGTFITGATVGPIKLQFAAGVAGQTITVRGGNLSYMKLSPR